MTPTEPGERNVTVRLPLVLSQMTGTAERCQVRGATIAEALQDLVGQHPLLAIHLFDESGAMRGHVLCCCNDDYLRGRAEALDVPVRPGDTIRILNAVSGG